MLEKSLKDEKPKSVPESKTSPKIQTKQKIPYLKIFIITLVVSFVIGSVSGAFFGGLASQGVTEFVRTKIFRQEPSETATQTSLTQSLTVKETSGTIEAVKKVRPAVVSIIVTKDLQQYYQQFNFPFDDEFFKEFFGQDFPGFKFESPSAPKEKQEVGGGTGFVVSSDGLILTNRHVVSDEEANYTVITQEGEKYDAKIKAKDPANDIALLEIDGKDLPVVEFGDSDSLEIGQTVIAIGNVLGQYQNTVTKGIVSGIGRNITASGVSGQTEMLYNIIQTDAAINPGNSGGPLINLAGQVIGINTAIDQGGQSIGFAIPINPAKLDIESVEKTGKISRPFLGIRYILITKEIAEENNLSVDYGVLIIRGSQTGQLAVIPGSPADKAGIEENDIILELNGQKLDENHPLARVIQEYKVGDQVQLKVLHKGEEKMVTATLGEME